jgi:hydroxymethylpyrimidine pyrophosphatase-like HAD family hydrolase
MKNATVLFSFDVDRTLVDRNRSVHSVSPSLRKEILLLNRNPNIAVVLNTGRDLIGLQEFDAELAAALDALYLSGRAIRRRGIVEVEPAAILPCELVEKTLKAAERLNMPFIDIKTSSGVLNIRIRDSSLPFGFQKPLNWYQRFRPHECDSADPQLFTIIEQQKPLRLEIPILESELDDFVNILELSNGFHSEAHPIHKEHLGAEHGSKLKGWLALQVLSPFETHNKGTILKQYRDRYYPGTPLVHFGDSSSNHNNDEIVLKIVPECRYISVNWERGQETEAELVNSIRALSS